MVSLFREDGTANPAYLKLDLYCKGLRIDASCDLGEDARDIIRNRAGLGSGLEVVIGADMFTNVPVVEWWVSVSPYVLVKNGARYEIWREDGFDRAAYATLDRGIKNRGPFTVTLDRSRAKLVDTVVIPPEPAWYKQKTSSGKLMQRIGCLQGTYLGIYWGPRCQNWGPKGENEFCKFCTEGQNLGREEEAEKSIADVIETVKAARAESGITFVHFNTGFIDSTDYWGLFKDVVAAVKKETGLLVGVQAPPDANFSNYVKFKQLGVNNISFCFEVLDEALFKEIGPGKARRSGLKRYLDAIDFCANEVGFDTVNGEIIAGLEPTESSKRAIDWICEHGAIPTVCVFRPVFGAAYAKNDPPEVEEMLPVFAHFY
ncbi:partial Bacteriochlorophyllide c C-7(1)-hydroxylase, partial [Planctomycetaceae bacterium]